MEALAEKSVINLIERISANTPLPAGGAVSALSATMAVSLCQMVTGLTKGKRIYIEADEEIKNRIDRIGKSSREMTGEFLELFEKDIIAYQKVMDAFKLPKTTDEEIKIRNKKIEEGYVGAMEVPLEVARKIVTVFEDIKFIIIYGNQNCITDAAVASLQAFAAIQGSILNVKTNLNGINDNPSLSKVRSECDDILNKAEVGNTEILEYVKRKHS